jgi:hypothetical protein
MVREVQQDFERLKGFIESYEIAGLLGNESYATPLKQGHSAYLALLTLWAEIKHRFDSGGIEIHGLKIEKGNTAEILIQEAVSDFGSALFCCLQGAYKPGSMALRSAVENYVRALAGVFSENASATTSVYELFALAKTTPPFSSVDGATALSKLHVGYKELCKHTHTASLDHMARIKSLDHFPTVHADLFQSWVREAKSVVGAIISSFMSAAESLYVTSHFRNRDVFDMHLSSEQRLRLIRGAS